MISTSERGRGGGCNDSGDSSGDGVSNGMADPCDDLRSDLVVKVHDCVNDVDTAKFILRLEATLKIIDAESACHGEK